MAVFLKLGVPKIWCQRYGTEALARRFASSSTRICSRVQSVGSCWRRYLRSEADQQSTGDQSDKLKRSSKGTKELDRRKFDESTSIVEQVFAEEERRPSTVVEKVKQTTKDVTYLGVIVGGVVVTGALFYLLFRELWSSKSPGGVYKTAFKMIRSHAEAAEALGEPVKAYGETTRRGRRRHPAHLEFVQDGVDCMRMKFYVEGALRKATAHLEVREDENKQYQFRYLYVQLDGQPSTTIVIADNR